MIQQSFLITLVAAFLAEASPSPVHKQLVNLRIPSEPSNERQFVDASYHGFSIEFVNFLDYTGNSTYTNRLNTNLVGNIKQLGKAPIHMRVGGSSQNVARWVGDAEVGLNPSYNGDKASRVWIGPQVIEGFNVWPEDTKYSWGLPFNFTTYDNLNGTDLQVATLVANHLGDKLDHLEIGNEFGHGFKGGPQGYVNLWLDYARNISLASFGTLDEKRFLIGSFQEPKCRFSEDPTCYDVKGILQLGIQDSGLAKTANTHMYMGAASESWTTHQFLMNHNNTAGKIDIHEELAAWTTSQGIPYVIGETNSLSGHGKQGVSDSFAAALWGVDYVLYGTQTNISRIFFHQGTGWKYSAWTPVEAFGYPAGVKGSYYAHLFTAAALGGGKKQVELIEETQQFSAYAIYADKKLDAIAAINLEAWNSTLPASCRPYATVVPPLEENQFKNAKVQRLTALGADSLSGITFSGKTVDDEGFLTGEHALENIKDGKVKVYASEAILIKLS